MEDNRISKKLAVFSVLLATIITGIGVAFGYFVWNSTTNTDISFTVEGAVVQLDDGSDITGANLMPVASYTSGGKNVVKKDIKIKLKDATSDTVTVDFKLKINSIDSGLNHSSFMYNLVNASGTSVKSGNFSTSKAGDTISLLTLSTSDGSLTTSLSTYTLYIYINGASGDNPSSMQNQSFDMSFIVEGSNSSRGYLPASEVIASLDDGTTGDSGSGVYKVSHSAIASSDSATGSEIKATDDYRYYGKNPNNYVCLEDSSGGTCSDKYLYRIIGSIYDEYDGTRKLKVIKDTDLVDDNSTKTWSWAYKTSVLSDGNYYNNIWATDTSTISSGSELMVLLNDLWINSKSGSYRNGSTSAISVNFSKQGLNDRKSLISVSRYYLGGNDDYNTMTSEIYLDERGSTTSDGNSNYWDGKVGLMYPSDYGYAAGTKCYSESKLSGYSDCSDKDWIFNGGNNSWAITPNPPKTINAWAIDYKIMYSTNTQNLRGVRPVFYLDKDVSIKSGTGTESDPYILS